MILAFGCSVAHGAETVTTGNSEENISYSYPALVAKYLNIECSNWAFCGNSNENIFHQAVENIPQYNNITAVIIGWTSPVREIWHADNRLWQFIPSWCSTSKDILTPITHIKDPRQWSDETPRMCCDKQEYLTALEETYRVLIKYKFDISEYRKKRQHYIVSLRSFCKGNNIKLIETTWNESIDGIGVNIGMISDWVNECRHPTKQEHQLIAKQIIDYYKL